MELLQRVSERVANADLHERRGRVDDLIGLIVEATGLEAEVGEVCTIDAGRRRPSVPAEVVGFRAGRTLLMPLGEIHGIG
ncbi:MAG: flagellum-specific synthase, partial [Solirubrobacteraceae bacterium]|nr:flagellum-specific synthase [Solirubrobacteraceae bacterium]